MAWIAATAKGEATFVQKPPGAQPQAEHKGLGQEAECSLAVQDAADAAGLCQAAQSLVQACPRRSEGEEEMLVGMQRQVLHPGFLPLHNALFN